MEKFIHCVRMANKWGLLFWLLCLAEFFIRGGGMLSRDPGESLPVYLSSFILVLPVIAFVWERVTRQRESYLHTLGWTMWCFAWIGMLSFSLIASFSDGSQFSWDPSRWSVILFYPFFMFANLMLCMNLIAKGWSWVRAVRWIIAK